MGSPVFGDEMPGRRAKLPQASRVIALQGDLDIATSPMLREHLNAIIADGVVCIVLNCAELATIDSTGLGILVSALKQTVNRSGALALAQPNEQVSRVLRVTGLDGIFPIYLTVDEACAALEIPEAA